MVFKARRQEGNTVDTEDGVLVGPDGAQVLGVGERAGIRPPVAVAVLQQGAVGGRVGTDGSRRGEASGDLDDDHRYEIRGNQG